MTARKARVAILWHMHQPYYRDLVSGRSMLPWARLHAVKDYVPMADILMRHPLAHVTVNFVPSLVKQIIEYTEEGLRDDFWEATAVPAADLSAKDRHFILRNFFMTNWDMTVKAIPRYAGLLDKRGYAPGAADLERAVALFSVQDYLDLQVWFNLVWFHPMEFEADTGLAELRAKGRNFSEGEKGYVLSRQLEIMGRMVPLYRKLMERGQVELSTSPFYHPILPLLVRMENAREALPGLDLPHPPLDRPEDAGLQLARAVEYHASVFGSPPAGLWPSEGSVSEDLLPLVMEKGFTWMASDEEILYRSLGMAHPARPATEEQRSNLLYRPYRLDRRGRSLSMVFRDHVVSDAIGFTYGHWEPRDAVADLMGRLDGAASRCAGRNDEPMVTVILDGENPWEYYREQGYPFLRGMYEALEKSTTLEATTVSEALAASRSGGNITRLFAGSWINHNFGIWIGHSEDRRAWELLIRARKALEDLEAEGGDGDRRKKMLEEILIAEGSDWTWWYGDENSSGNDEAFDELYRLHLKNVFTLSGRDVPDEFKVSVFTGRRVRVPIIRIYSFIKPVLDGRVSSYFEWLAAGEYSIERQGSTMHRADSLLSGIYFGFDLKTLYIRVDPAMRMMANDLGKYAFSIHLLKPLKVRIEISPRPGGPPRLTVHAQEGGALPRADLMEAALKDILELAVPFSSLSASEGDQVEFFVSLSREGLEVGHWPNQGSLSLTVPGADFEEKIWSI